MAQNRINFLVAGTQKGGTSTLDAYLRAHPQITMPTEKETHFFNQDRWFQGSEPAYAHYHSLFNMETDSKIIGEVTPAYMHCPRAPQRIWDYNPQIKILVVLRNPTDRAYSHWNMQRERGIEHLSFWDALQAEEHRRSTTPLSEHKQFAYISRGYYHQQLMRIWSYFPREQTLAIKSTDLWKLPAETLSRVTEFLHLDPFTELKPQRIRAGSYSSVITPQEREYLIALFHDDLKHLERALDWDCSEWLQ